MYNILPYSYSGPIVNHIVHFGPLLPRGVKINGLKDLSFKKFPGTGDITLKSWQILKIRNSCKFELFIQFRVTKKISPKSATSNFQLGRSFTTWAAAWWWRCWSTVCSWRRMGKDFYLSTVNSDFVWVGPL